MENSVLFPSLLLVLGMPRITVNGTWRHESGDFYYHEFVRVTRDFGVPYGVIWGDYVRWLEQQILDSSPPCPPCLLA